MRSISIFTINSAADSTKTASRDAFSRRCSLPLQVGGERRLSRRSRTAALTQTLLTGRSAAGRTRIELYLCEELLFPSLFVVASSCLSTLVFARRIPLSLARVAAARSASRAALCELSLFPRISLRSRDEGLELPIRADLMVNTLLILWSVAARNSYQIPIISEIVDKV